MKRNLLISFIIMFSYQLHAQETPRNNDSNFPEAKPTNSKVEYIVQQNGPYKVDYIPDVKYATKDNTDLRLQVFVPRENNPAMKEKFPLVIFVKGSAWMKQNIYNTIPQIADLAKRGFVVAEVEYRHTGIAPFPAQREDALSAIKFMTENATAFKADTSNIFVMGDSSGAHTALFSGLKLTEDEKLPDIKGIIAYYPPTNLLVMKDDPTAATTGDAKSPEGLLMGGVGVEENPQKAKEISPYYYFDKTTKYPPLFLAHGTKDRVVPFSQSDILANRLEEEGIKYEFYALKNADHGSWEFWTPAMYDKVEDFIRRNMR